MRLIDPVAAKQVTAWLSDEPMIYDKLTPYEYLEFVAGLWRIEPKVAEQRARELIGWLGLEPHAHERCEGFSRGMRQKVALAGALVHDPKLIILDEPLTGLDAGSARTVKNVLRERVAAGGTVIMTTHILEVAERMADRIGIIAKGKLIAEGTLDELRRQDRRDRLQPRGYLPDAGRRAGGVSQPATLTWLAGHELRLGWRDWASLMTAGGRTRARNAVIALAIFAAFMHVFAYWIVAGYAGAGIATDTATLVVITGTLVLSWSLLLSQAMELVTRAFYAKSDLDLILTSPASARKVFAVRMGRIAGASVLVAVLIAAPFIDVLAFLGGAHWLAAYGVVAALGAVATAVALALTIALFRLIGAKRTRLIAQIVAAVIGAAFVIGLQIAAIFSAGNLSRFAALQSDWMLARAPDTASAFWFPARAVLGRFVRALYRLSGQPSPCSASPSRCSRAASANMRSPPPAFPPSACASAAGGLASAAARSAACCGKRNGRCCAAIPGWCRRR